MKVNNRHFGVFKSECERWADIYGMKGWRLEYALQEVDGGIAEFDMNLEAKAIFFSLATEAPEYYLTDKELMRLAFHEITESFINRLALLRVTDDIAEERHNIVNTLEKILYPKYRKKRV
jgi:hypothetical protein